MTSDLIAAARAMIEEMDRPGFFTANGHLYPCRELRDMVATLADALTALQAENQRLRNEVSDLRSYAERAQGKAREILGYAPPSTEASHD